MNNRFKFRIWNQTEKKYFICPHICIDTADDKAFIACDDDEVLEQCTGLRDDNGRLIYEGDIVRQISKREPEYEEYITEVKWNVSGYPLYDEESFDFEVIGNIHENPELMEE